MSEMIWNQNIKSMKQHYPIVAEALEKEIEPAMIVD